MVGDELVEEATYDKVVAKIRDVLKAGECSAE